MRKVSPRRAALNREVRQWRNDKCQEVGRCECCLLPTSPELLEIDEIARGSGHRPKALDKAFAVLIVRKGPYHHARIQTWSRAKRLALLYLARSSDYDLASFHELTGRRFPSQEEVDAEIQSLLSLRPTATAKDFN